MEFYETRTGHTFYNCTMPAIQRSLESLAAEMREQNRLKREGNALLTEQNQLLKQILSTMGNNSALNTVVDDGEGADNWSLMPL